MVDRLKGYFTNREAVRTFIHYDADKDNFFWKARKPESLALLPNIYTRILVDAGGDKATQERVDLICKEFCDRWNSGQTVGRKIRFYQSTTSARGKPAQAYAVLDDCIVTVDTLSAAFQMEVGHVKRIAKLNPKLTKGQKMAIAAYRKSAKAARSQTNKARWAEARDKSRLLASRVMRDRGFSIKTSPERWRFIEESMLNFLWKGLSEAEAIKAAGILLDGPDPENVLSVAPTGETKRENST